MTRQLASLVPAIALSFALGGVAQAQTPAPASAPAPHAHRDGGGLLERADANHDGFVSRDEFLAARATLFTRMDRNHDGFLDAQDLPERAKEHPRAMERLTAMIQQFDTDHDGKVNEQEFAQGATPMFDKADTDGNGSLDKNEIAAAREQTRARFQERRKRPQ